MNVAHGQSPDDALGRIERLLVVSPNWLGDAVMALPAVTDLRRAAPKASVSVAARPSIAPLYGMVPGIDRTLTIDGKASAAETIRQIQQHAFDVAVLLPNSWRSAWLAWRSGIGERWGYRADWRGPFLTRAIARPRGGHQGAYYQTLTRALGAPSGPLEPRLSVRDSDRKSGAAALERGGWDGKTPLVALAPGAAYGTAKRWPAESFAAVADGLLHDGAAIVLVGAAADRGAGRDMMMALERRRTVTRGSAIDVTGQTDLPALAGLLAQCRALVSNDSGAMHVGAAVGLPVTAPFGPTRETETRPLGEAHTVLTASVFCRPCMLRTCPIDHRCMRRIEPDSVLTAVRRSL